MMDLTRLRGKLESGLQQLAEQSDRPEVFEGACSNHTLERLLAWLALLVKWNRAYNLTAVRDPNEMVVRHLLDCLAVLPHIEAGELLDVGAGPGLPGAVLAIARPDLSVTLVDSNLKMTRFAELAALELKLDNLRVRRSRVETLGGPEYRQIISRAFASLEDFLKLAGSLCAPGGRMLAMKGRCDQQELAVIRSPWRLESILPLSVPFLEGQRHLVIIRRNGEQS